MRVWEVRDAAGRHRGLFFGDYFARPSKHSGAWMTRLRWWGMRETCWWNLGTTYRRQALVVCEGSPPAADPRQGTLVTSRMEVRSALGPAITRAGGIQSKEDDARS